eukprot:SAG11_NODE_21100_length_432_cov_0.927928_2_plen_73_part_01
MRSHYAKSLCEMAQSEILCSGPTDLAVSAMFCNAVWHTYLKIRYIFATDFAVWQRERERERESVCVCVCVLHL